MLCPLCSGSYARGFAEVQGLSYYRCPVCALTFLSPSGRVDPASERSRYETHENDPADPRYRRFLNRLAAPLVDRLPAGATGLDFGSGPGPTLSVMLEEQGFDMEIYDPFFAPNERLLERSWDFLTCTEVAEHLFEPGREFARLDRILRPGGWLGMMTEVLDDDEAFEGWHYVRDPTHVCFFRPETLEWIADRHGWELERPSRTVALFRKPGVPDHDEPAPGTTSADHRTPEAEAPVE